MASVRESPNAAPARFGAPVPARREAVRLAGRDSAVPGSNDLRGLGGSGSSDGGAGVARRTRTQRQLYRCWERADGEGAVPLPRGRPVLAVRARGRPPLARSSDLALVSASRGALASSPRARERPGRRQALARPIPFIVAFAAKALSSRTPASPNDRDMGTFLESDAGQGFRSGELGLVRLPPRVLGIQHRARRGTPLSRASPPRMNRAFGRGGLGCERALFAAYHVHVPWVIPATLLIDTFTLAYPSKRTLQRLGRDVVHSAQSAGLWPRSFSRQSSKGRRD